MSGAQNNKIPIPRYPTSPAYEMKFNAAVFGFTIARADNGFVFQEYDPTTDETHRKIATTPEQLQAIFDTWHKERTGKFLEWAREYLAQNEA